MIFANCVEVTVSACDAVTDAVGESILSVILQFKSWAKPTMVPFFCTWIFDSPTRSVTPVTATGSKQKNSW